MPTIDSAVAQAADLIDKGNVRQASPVIQGMMSAPPLRDVSETLMRFPMPSFQAFSDPVRQGNRESIVPQYRTIPPTPTPATNVTVVKQAVTRTAGGGTLVVSSGGSSVVTNKSDTPGAPGIPSGGIPAPPSVAGDLTATAPMAVSSVRQVLGGPAVVSVDTFGASGPSHSRGVAPDPGAAAGITRFLREDASWALLPADVELEPVTNGDPAFPELVFSGGDLVLA